MRGLFTNLSHSLTAGDVLSGTAARAETLRVKHGKVWITVEGISHDYFLHAGDSFTAIPGRLTVLQAEQDAGIERRRSQPFALLRLAGRMIARIGRGMTTAPTVNATLQRGRGCNDACC